jgi:hypothetical protein
MRALFILIKRLIVDDAVYFGIALIGSATLILITLLLVFSDEPLYMPFNKITHLIWVPVYVGIGFCVLGTIQSHSDRTKGISALLLVLPVRRGQILAAHVVTGTLIILTVLGPLAITGAIVWQLLLAPIPLFRGGFVDLCVGAFLTAFACYCLGLHTGAKARSFTLALAVLLLVPTILLLIVIKGLGRPFLGILVPFIAASLLRWMIPATGRPVTTLATGFVVLVLLAVPLYWGRYLCEVAFVTNMPPDNVEIRPSGLLPPEIENAPGVAEQSVAVGHPYRSVTYFGRIAVVDWFFAHLGIMDYFYPTTHDARHVQVYCDWRWPTCLYFDQAKGQFVYLDREKKLYAGPEGVSETPGAHLGRFISPVVWPGDLHWPELYDRRLRRFFSINFRNGSIRKGPEVETPAYEPVDIIGSTVKSETCGVNWHPPYKEAPYGTEGYYRMPTIRYNPFTSYGAVVDELGSIHLLDRETLKLVGPVGHLARPRTLFGWGSQRPKDLPGYDVDLVATSSEAKYDGMVVGSLSRQGTSMTLTVLDNQGNEVRKAHTKALPYEAHVWGTERKIQQIDSANATLFEVPWGPTLTITKYLLESLHPPALTLASFFAAYSFEAGSTHRAIFFMPNSFVALQQDRQVNIILRFLAALLFMLPALLLAGLLSWRVTRDAEIVGLSQRARRVWLLATLAFGLVGYITYKLTRPKETLVTCVNCGKLRRPDMDRCHRCGSRWQIPELMPPTWRVVDI